MVCIGFCRQDLALKSLSAFTVLVLVLVLCIKRKIQMYRTVYCMLYSVRCYEKRIHDTCHIFFFCILFNNFQGMHSRCVFPCSSLGKQSKRERTVGGLKLPPIILKNLHSSHYLLSQAHKGSKPLSSILYTCTLKW